VKCGSFTKHIITASQAENVTVKGWCLQHAWPTKYMAYHVLHYNQIRRSNDRVLA